MLRFINRITLCRLFGHSFKRIVNGFHWYRHEDGKPVGQWSTTRCGRCDEFSVRYTGEMYFDTDGTPIPDGHQS